MWILELIYRDDIKSEIINFICKFRFNLLFLIVIIFN